MIDSDDFLGRAVRTRIQHRDYEQKIETLLEQMTLEEKVGDFEVMIGGLK
jgi:hypothetical protein